MRKIVVNKALTEYLEKREKKRKIEKILELISTDEARAREFAKDCFGVDVPSRRSKDFREEMERKKWHLTEGMYFPCVFCDTHTLFSKEGKLNNKLLCLLKEISTFYPVNLWTDGHISNLKMRFDFTKIEFPILNKSFFRGSTIEIAYENVPKEIFTRDLGIKVNDHRMVAFS